MAELLEEAGFRVVEAAHANEALTILNSGLPISVLLTDVDMPPGPDGFELSRIVGRFWPDVEILIMSGRCWPANGDLPPGAAFLAKPCPNDAIVLHARSAADRAWRSRARKEPQDMFQGIMAAEITAPDATGTVVPFPKTA